MLHTLSSLLPTLVWTLLCGVFLTLGDIILRMWFASEFRNGFLIALLVYIAGIFCMMMSFFEKNIAVASIAAVLINIIVYLVIAHYLYGDSLNIWQITGISLGLVAIIILELH